MPLDHHSTEEPRRRVWRPSLRAALVAALAAFAFFNTLTWSLSQPPYVGFDETGYAEVADFIRHKHRFPVFDEDRGFGVRFINIGLENPYPYMPYADRPGLAMVIAAGSMAFPTDSTWMDAFQMRAPGAVYAALLVLFSYGAARAMLPGRPAVAVLVAMFAATWPQVSAIFSTLNDDGLTTMLCSAIIWAWYSGARRGWPVRSALVLGAAMGFLLLGKPNGFILVAMSTLVAMLTLRGRPLQVLGRLGAAVLAMVAVAGWRYAIAVRDYGLDIFSSERKAELLERANAANHPARDHGFSFWDVLFFEHVVTPMAAGAYLPNMADLFLANFTHIHLRLPGLERLIVLALFAIALSEVAVHGVTRLRAWARERGRGTPSPVARVHLLVVLLPFVVVLAASWNAYANEYIHAGHYLFPMLFPVLVVFGLGLWLHGGRRAPGYMALVTLVMLALNAHGRYIVGAHYNQPLDHYLGRWQTAILIGWVASIALVAMLALAYWRRSVHSSFAPEVDGTP